MNSELLPKKLAKWASAAVANYRQVSLWPEYGNTHETIVRVYLLNWLAAAGFQVRIEVAEEALQRAISKGNPGSMKGNRGGADIVFGKEGKLCGLIEVKRSFPEGGTEGVMADVRRLQVFENLPPSIARYVVVVLGANWEKRSKERVEKGLLRWHELFGRAIVAEEKRAGMKPNRGGDCWVSLVLDASRVDVVLAVVVPRAA